MDILEKQIAQGILVSKISTSTRVSASSGYKLLNHYKVGGSARNKRQYFSVSTIDI
jgi:transposase